MEGLMEEIKTEVIDVLFLVILTINLLLLACRWPLAAF